MSPVMRPVLDVVEVEADGVVPVEVGSTTHLPETADPWLHHEATVRDVIVEGDFFLTLRPRADKAHVSAEHIEELR